MPVRLSQPHETKKGKMMPTPKELVQSGWELWAKGDFDALAQRYSQDAEVSLPGMPPVKGRDAISATWKAFRAAFPDEHPVQMRHLAEGNTVVSIWTLDGTHTGPLPMPDGQTLPATGNKLITKGVSVEEVQNELVKSQTFYWDTASFMSQLGLMPEAQPASAG
jgi:steroid delta-isomerase-like uncharacterized protein